MNYVLNEKDTIYADLDPTEGVILHSETKHYFKLNETSQIIWKAIQKGLGEQGAVSALCDHFDVTEEEALADVKAFQEKLRQEKFLILEKSPASFSVKAAKESKSEAN